MNKLNTTTYRHFHIYMYIEQKLFSKVTGLEFVKVNKSYSQALITIQGQMVHSYVQVQ